MRVSDRMYDAWASLFVYPDDEGRALAVDGVSQLCGASAAGSEELGPLEAFLARPARECEEHFTRTFDGSESRALEVGWHLHGENYARGALMVRFRGLLGELGLVETSELPDHIGVVLGVLGRLEDDRANALARGVVLPALERLQEGFENDLDPYRAVVAGVRSFLAERHPPEPTTAPRQIPKETEHE